MVTLAEYQEKMNAIDLNIEQEKNESRKLSRTMAVILGLIVTLEVMIAGGMIFNIDFHSADTIAVILGFFGFYIRGVCCSTD